MPSSWRSVRCPACDQVLYLRWQRLTAVVSRNSRVVFASAPAAVQCRNCGFEVVNQLGKQEQFR